MRPLVEILYFDGCPNHHPAIALVERIGQELGIEPDVHLVNVRDQAAAQQLRFLGSPTIRVGGVDVDPHAEERDDYALSCRVLGTDTERWVREALQRERRRRGRARLEPLSPGERDLYDWILNAFAAGTPPEPDTLADAASTCGVDVDAALAAFAREDLVHHDSATGAILVAYPFSGIPRGHRVRIDGEHEVEAMCAVDALGIAPMLDREIEITSRDPLTGGEVWVRLDPGEGAWWEPQTAVVLDGSASDAGPSLRTCCGVLNFFESGESAGRYLNANPDISGRAIPLPDAIELGRNIFGELLKGGEHAERDRP